MTAVKNSSESGTLPRLRRRQFVAGGVLGAAGLLARADKSAAAVDIASWLVYKSSGPDGASVHYPPTWMLDPSTTRELSLDPYLLYPHQSFSLRTTPSKPPDDTSEPDSSGLPDLTGYPTDAAIIWLMYYDDIVEGAPISGLSLATLEQRKPTEFNGFGSYIARFSNSARSFLLRAWIGSSVPSSTVSAIDACLKTIQAPSR